MTKQDVAERSKQKGVSKNPFKARQVTAWESGSTGLDYRRLVEDVLPAYRIDDFDTFIDYCIPPTLADITVIEDAHFGAIPIAPGITNKAVGLGFLNNHRTRIDRVEFSGKAPAEPTSWAPHNGHEFVLVLEGSVVCELAANEHDTERFTRTLTEGQAIAFHSGLYHRFSNASETNRAKLVAAKPSHSRTAATKPN